MKRREFLRIGSLAAIGASTFPTGWVSAADKRPQKVLYYTRSTGYEHSPVHEEKGQASLSTKALTEVGRKAGFEVVATKDGRVFDGDLDQYDAFVLYCCGNQCVPGKRPENLPMTPEGKQRLLDAVAAGKGCVGFHSAADTFHSPKDKIDPYVTMIGAEFMGHGTQQPGDLKVTGPKFPGLDGVADPVKIEREEWYSFRNFGHDLHVILVQETGMMKKTHERDKFLYSRPPFPQTWARMHGKGRVFYTSFGHVEAIWSSPLFVNLTLGGLAWAMRNVDAQIPPNIDQATPGAWDVPKKA